SAARRALPPLAAAGRAARRGRRDVPRERAVPARRTERDATGRPDVLLYRPDVHVRRTVTPAVRRGTRHAPATAKPGTPPNATQGPDSPLWLQLPDPDVAELDRARAVLQRDRTG